MQGRSRKSLLFSPHAFPTSFRKVNYKQYDLGIPLFKQTKIKYWFLFKFSFAQVYGMNKSKLERVKSLTDIYIFHNWCTWIAQRDKESVLAKNMRYCCSTLKAKNYFVKHLNMQLEHQFCKWCTLLRNYMHYTFFPSNSVLYT